MKLYSFFRSGTSHRLRIALNLKGVATDYVAVDLRVDEQLNAPFKAVNPQGLVPALDTVQFSPDCRMTRSSERARGMLCR